MYHKKLFAIAAVILLTAGIAGIACGAPPPVFDVDREFYPYYPSLMKWNKSNAEFTPPAVCADCHEKQYQEWTGSVHSLAFQDPIYRGELNKAVNAIGHDIARQCEGCHSAAGVLTGEIKGAGNSGLSPMAMAGVSCDICHSVSGVTHWQTPSHEAENGSFILTPGVAADDGVRLVKRGPAKPDSECGGGFHDCVESGLHLQADLCASCHQVYHHESHFPIEATYNEWKHGPYAQKSILCQDCHMVETETFKRSADTFAKPAPKEYRHYFNGANYLLSYLAAGAAKKAGNQALADNAMRQYEMAVARLKSAADLEIYPLYRDKRLTEVKVRVKNIRAGHNLPTSLTNVRQMWLEVTVKDERGGIIMTTGTIRPDGSLPDDTRNFNSDGMGSDFHFAIDPWIVTAFSRHETIPPKGYRDTHYGIAVPAGVQKVNIEAKLRFRQADQKVAEKLLAAVPRDIDLEKIYGLKAVPPLPVVDMVVKETSAAASP